MGPWAPRIRGGLGGFSVGALGSPGHLGPRFPGPSLGPAQSPKEYEFPEPKEYEFPEPKEFEFPEPKEYESPEPKEYEFPKPKKYEA